MLRVAANGSVLIFRDTHLHGDFQPANHKVSCCLRFMLVLGVLSSANRNDIPPSYSIATEFDLRCTCSSVLFACSFLAGISLLTRRFKHPEEGELTQFHLSFQADAFIN